MGAGKKDEVAGSQLWSVGTRETCGTAVVNHGRWAPGKEPRQQQSVTIGMSRIFWSKDLLFLNIGPPGPIFSEKYDPPPIKMVRVSVR